MNFKRISNKNLRVGGVYLLANVINKAIAFITIPIFSRLLTTSEYGLVSTYTSYVMILQYFMGLSSEYTVRNAYVDYREEIDKYISSMYLLATCCSLIIGILIFMASFFVMHISMPILCVCCIIQSYFTYVNNAATNKLMMEKSFVKRAVITAAPNLLSAGLGIIFILVMGKNKEIGRVLGYVIAISAFGIYNLLTTWHLSKPCINRKYWNYILEISPPLIIHGLSVIILSQFDRIMLTSLRTSSETGVYSIIYSLSMVANAVTSALEGIWTPWFTEMYEKADYEKINKRSYKYLIIASILMICIMCIAPEILKFMTPRTYWSGIKTIPVLVLASYFIYMYSFYVNLELYEKKTKRIASITVIAAVINVVLNYIFIPDFGAIAAAGTTLFAYVVSFILHCSYGRRLNQKCFSLRLFMVPMFFLFCVTCVFYITLDMAVMRWLIGILTCAVITFVYKDILG